MSSGYNDGKRIGEQGLRTRMSAIQVLLLVVVCSSTLVGAILVLRSWEWYISWRVRRWAERLRREEAAGMPPRPRDFHFAISFDTIGFTVTNLRAGNQESVRIGWNEINRA